MTWSSTRPENPDGDRLNVLGQAIEAAEAEHRALNRTVTRPEVRVGMESPSAYSLHPSYSWPTPRPGRTS
jgi:hypothetical protein